MKKVQLFKFAAITISFLAFSCGNPTGNKKEITDSSKTPKKPLRERVLTVSEQKALTPELIIKALKDGNKRFVSNDLTLRDHSAMVRDAAAGQYPKAVILSCVDSRIPVEDVFDRGIGDIFVARVAGNFSNVDILGSLEFACKVSGAKVILVLGHESCGAIKSAIDDVKLGNITSMLYKIKPAVALSSGFAGEKSSKNPAFVELVAKNNIRHTIQTIKSESPILKEMSDHGDIKIVGAYYDLHTGAVEFL
ncbi:carbonic anhydrase [Mucilaginibacter pineti]|uniref:Carbonic anhydrase n=1 Tax=Mucilaginibacter pineti TaxID=1391627 RepID=A0A1G7F3F7_9SPHI|nr:carbonic anhydrase family protein [Mucilaginibacter pineti]SDE70454.1 carbonic anhydrase [Mucilaginibacter pineti]